MPPGLNTQQLVEVHDIRDNVLILKNGSLRALVEVNSVNFELKSPDEQAAMIQGFKNFLNSLDFPLQIIIHSRKLDIANYLERTAQMVENTGHELLRIQGRQYVQFVQSLVELANVMTKKFYLVVPFHLLETRDEKRGFWENLKSAFGSAQTKIKELENEKFLIYQAQLNQRIELVTDGLQGMGLTSRLVNQEKLLAIFTSLYNPGFN